MAGGTSDYRGPSINPDQQNITYSTITKQQPLTKFPTKNQAIILPAVDEIRTEEYTIAVGTIVHPKNVLFSSKMSNGRICIYLSSTQVVDDFLSQHGEIKIREHTIKARKLITPANRLVLSNVCPSIPHHIIEQSLMNLGFKLMSPISFLRAGIQDPQYSHVLSFRRQVYFAPTDNFTVPDSVLIDFENISYRIFLSDKLTCYKCHQAGHVSSDCSSNPSYPQNTQKPQTEENFLPQIPSTSPEQNQITNINDESREEMDAQVSTATDNKNKRSYSEVSSPTCSTPTETIPTEFTKPKPVQIKKKKKIIKIDQSTSETTNIESLLQPVKQFIQDASPPYVLNYTQLLAFLEDVHGSSTPVELALEYTQDIHGLGHMLTEIYPILNERAIKSRITRIKKKLLSKINKDFSIQDDTSEDTDASQENTPANDK